jgi:hypothetical protein
VQRSLFSRRNFAAAGDRANSGAVFATLGIEMEVCLPYLIAGIDSRKGESEINYGRGFKFGGELGWRSGPV